MASSVISRVDALFDNDCASPEDCNGGYGGESGVSEVMGVTGVVEVSGVSDEQDDAMVTPDSDLDRYILGEIDRRTSKSTSWKMLEQCFRWSRVQEYLTELGLQEDAVLVADLKMMLVQKKLNDVVYDNKSHKVVRLTHRDI
eukprot:gene29453-5798_t